MRDGFLDGREGIGCGHWNVNLAGRYHLRRLRRGWGQFRRKLRVAHEETPHGERLEDDVQWADRHRRRAHGRKADERAVRGERRRKNPCRWAADTIKRQAKLSMADRR